MGSDDDDDDGRGLAEVTFRDLTPENEPELRRLNAVIFPIRYSDKFYAECGAAGRATQLAYVDGALAGAIAVRLELLPDRSAGSGARMYVMTVGVLAPHRGAGIGTRLLRHALNEGSADAYIVDAYLHVQTNNAEAIAFYERFGFERDGVAKGYYKRLDPPDAAVLKLDLRRWKREPLEGVKYEDERAGGG